MLTALDSELFPDDCEVVEIPPRGLKVYLIQKNGSTSLRLDAEKHGWRILKNKDLRSLPYVDVYIRDPRDRYLSGINTFLQYLLRDVPGLDRKTCIYLVLRYPFLNRHFLPQWHWLANLARFLNPNCVIRLHDLKDLENVTKFRSNAGIEPYDVDWPDSIAQDIDKMETWFLLDKILLGLCGQSLTWSSLLEIYRDHPTKPLELIIERFQQLTDVLRQT